MLTLLRKCLSCAEPFQAVDRRQKYCTEDCRLDAKNRSVYRKYPEGQNHDLSCLQPIDIVGSDFAEYDNSEPPSPSARSRKELRFEEYPPRKSKRDRCIAYKLTDGKQINADGRVSRPLGYVTEIWPGRWVAKVGNVSSLTLPLSAAKNAAVELYRSKDKGESRDWIADLNRAAANEIDRAAIKRERPDRGKWPIDLVGGPRRGRGDPELRRSILDTELGERPTEALQGDDYPLEYYEDGFPKIPDCLKRASKEVAAR
jgi:hypothetical protein